MNPDQRRSSSAERAAQWTAWRLRGRLVTNLVVLGIAAAALVTYLVADLLADALFADTYQVSVTLPASGGLISGQEVTVSGRVVGFVDDVDLAGDHVVAVLDILADERIPADSDVIVQRRSTVGEQAIDFKPDTGGPAFYGPGDEIDGLDAELPVAVQRVLEVTDEVLSEVDEATTAALVGELADAVRGRKQDLRSIVTESAEFSRTIADGGEEFDRLFREGRTVTGALAAVRQDLARSVGEMADATEILVAMRDDFDRLLVDGPPALAQAGTLVEHSQADIACLLGHFAATNAYLNAPRQLDNIERALRANRFFFDGFDMITPQDPAGRVWHRVHVVLEEDPPPERYAAKRPIPATLPGGACVSPFGRGAGEATQADFTLVVPDGRLVAPDDDVAAEGAASSSSQAQGVAPVAVEAGGPGQDANAGGGAAAAVSGLLALLACASVLTARWRGYLAGQRRSGHDGKPGGQQ